MSDKNEILDPNDPLKTLLRESAMEQAPETLVSNVMRAIDAETSTFDTGKPLISTLGWALITTPLSRWIENLRFPSIEFSHFPDTVWLGVLAFGFYGLLQLFWMKRQMDQQRLF